jgi:hypothetical protein
MKSSTKGLFSSSVSASTKATTTNTFWMLMSLAVPLMLLSAWMLTPAALMLLLALRVMLLPLSVELTAVFLILPSHYYSKKKVMAKSHLH